MSDPMTNAEVEDVLSSIRRLVSENKAPAAEPTELTKPDRLVLTPALRVADEPEDSEEVAEFIEVELSEEDEARENQDVLAALDAYLKHEDHAETEDDGHLPEEAEEASEPAWEDTSSEEDTAEPEEAFAEAAEAHDAEEVEAETAEDDAFHIEFSHTPYEGPETASEQAVEEQAAEDEVQDDEGEEYTPEDVAEWDEGEPEHDAAPEAEDADVETAEQPFSDESDSDTYAQMSEPAPELEEGIATASLGDKVAALETLIQGRRDRWEPDDNGTDEYAGTDAPAMTWEDATPDLVDTAPRAETIDQTPIKEERDDTDILTSDEAEMDEETLRELVSDIVREELQGALGERITRNVRKLVRREIHRVLASQDFD